jgi:hypothetical protein
MRFWWYSSNSLQYNGKSDFRAKKAQNRNAILPKSGPFGFGQGQGT